MCEEDQTSVKIEYRVTEEEAVAQYFRAAMMPRLKYILAFTVVCGVLTALVLPAFWLVVLPLVLFATFVPFRMRQNVQKYVAQHPELLETQSLIFNQSSICAFNSCTRVSVTWDKIKSFDERDGFLMYRIDTMGTGGFVPLTAMSAEQLDKLRSYMTGGASNKQ